MQRLAGAYRWTFFDEITSGGLLMTSVSHGCRPFDSGGSLPSSDESRRGAKGGDGVPCGLAGSARGEAEGCVLGWLRGEGSEVALMPWPREAAGDRL
jgi:hypothetical protein